jgi:hypothetical protein
MRLSPEQIAQIRQSAAESFGPEARVWLFGSRVAMSSWAAPTGLRSGCLYGKIPYTVFCRNLWRWIWRQPGLI